MHGDNQKTDVMATERVRYVLLGLLSCLLATAGCSSQKRPGVQEVSKVPVTSVDSLRLVVDPVKTTVSGITDLDVLPGHDLAVLDADQKKVLLFHPSGERYAAFGRSGKGPGEFVAPRGVDVRDFVIRILDVGLQRFSRYDTEGHFLQGYDTQREASFFGFVTPGDSLAYYTVANGRHGKLVGYHNPATDSVGYFGDAPVSNPPPVTDQQAFKNGAANGEVSRAISNDLVMDYAEDALYVFLKSHSRLQKYRRRELLWDIKIEHPANEKIFDRFTENVLSGPSAFGMLRYIDGMAATSEHAYLLWKSSPQTVLQVSAGGELQRVYKLPVQKDHNFNSLAVDPGARRLYLGDASGAKVYAFSLD